MHVLILIVRSNFLFIKSKNDEDEAFPNPNFLVLSKTNNERWVA